MRHHPPTKTPPDKIAAAVRRYLAGESVTQLAKEFKVSHAGFYLWIKKAKEDADRAQRLREVGAAGVAKEDAIDRDLRLRKLEQECDRLRKAMFDLMVKHNEI